ncbi:MAG: hypothetical protein QG574_5673, partial [Cyanobacteriota bacterium erpe_2018_sw_21hr_WHONDRS-SW48-000092_B_bin.40]|nr:hypothetical protein [Cyanobacteriota bacterium erpe_2018_sw_21hr_WHONDRS-SW48-000092_B_bin.40]MDQ5938310.1 hypothetical protein [Cyanobacteriota bacterium erpe_2018_sw_21hr_WHONDRS-SW48-000092_B_bin.40]
NYYPKSVVYHYHGASSRFRRIGATINLHKGMEVFYRKHMAKQYWPIFNVMVYAAIWFRAGIFIVLSWLQQFVPEKKDAGVFGKSVEEDTASAAASKS